jgi:hypothetical protein
MYEEDYDGEPHDYGFDLPDTRYEFIAKDGGNISISIVRHWCQSDDGGSPDFRVSWDIHYHNPLNNETSHINLPIGSTEDQAIEMKKVAGKLLK